MYNKWVRTKNMPMPQYIYISCDSSFRFIKEYQEQELNTYFLEMHN